MNPCLALNGLYLLVLGQAYGCNEHVDYLNAQERQKDSSKTVGEEIPCQNLGGGERPKINAFERDRNQRDKDYRIKDESA